MSSFHVVPRFFFILAGIAGLEPTPAVLDTATLVLHTTTIFIAISVCGLDYIFILCFHLDGRLSSLYGRLKPSLGIAMDYSEGFTDIIISTYTVSNIRLH